LAIGTSTPTNLGATQFTINDSNTAGTSGLISFTDSDVVKSYDYVTNNYRYVDTNTGVGIVLKPDADSTKSWVIDTDGDLVSNGGNWASGNIYMNNLIASSSVTASYILVDEDITANNFIGNIQATNGVVSGSQQIVDSLPSGVVSGSKQITDFGFISESNSLYNDQFNLAIGTNTPTNLGATQFTINDSNTAGTSGLISFTDSDVVKSYDYVNSNYRYIDTNTGVGIVLKPDSDSNKSWVIDTDGDLVSNGGSWTSGNAYMNNLIASSSVTASYILVDKI
jgi:pyruvate/2-oxoacid:ferredoxin oxidoreductase beta subunit